MRKQIRMMEGKTMPRPKGSKNKKTIAKATAAVQQAADSISEKMAEVGNEIVALTEQLKAKKAELKQLIREKAKAEKAAAKKKAAEEKAKLLKAVESSGKTVDEILAMIQPAKEDKE